MVVPRRRFTFFVLPLVCACSSAVAPSESVPTAAPVAASAPAVVDIPPAPPLAAERPHAVPSPHGARMDAYYWLRDDERKDPDVLAYLEAENAYRDKLLAPLRPLQQALYDEIVGRIARDDSTVPYRHRGYFYYSRVTEGSEYPIYARKLGSLEAPEQIMLNANERAAGHEYYSARGLEVSPDGKLLAFAEDTIGRRQYTIRFRDLATGQFLADELPGSSTSMAWADDNRTLFYVENDPQTLLGVRVKRHELGTTPAKDVIVYEEPDHSYYMGVGRTGDDRFVTISLQSTTTSEVRYLPASRATGEFRVLAPRTRDVEYDADHIAGRWVVRTNWEAKNFRLMTVPDRRAGDRKHWKEVVAHDPAVMIEGFELLDDYLVAEERSGGLRRLRVRSWDGKREFFVDSDEKAYSTYLDVNAEDATHWLRYSYTSMTTPNTVYEVDLVSGERRLLKQDPVLGGFDAANYATDRVWATARDGVQVPVTLMYRKGFRPDGTAPLFQYAYGSYGASMDPNFSSSVLSLVDRGFVYAVAHVRGGSEMGRHWYEDGKLLRKINTFTDFIDVTEYLVAQGYGAKDKVVAEGGSAGGLLIGAVANLRPDLYRALVARVPFVDVVTTMLDESIPLTTNEFDEWGNPKVREFYDYMLSYSPYDNVTSQAYPAMLVTTGLWDSQVQYYEPAKWVAKLRRLKTDENPLVFHVEMGAGHGGKSGRFRRYEERAMSYAFMLGQVGLVQ